MQAAQHDQPATTVDVVPDDAPGGDDVVGLLERLGRREVSAAELQSAARARAERANAALNAVATWVEPGQAPRTWPSSTSCLSLRLLVTAKDTFRRANSYCFEGKIPS